MNANVGHILMYLAAEMIATSSGLMIVLFVLQRSIPMATRELQ